MKTCDVCGGSLLHGKCRECGALDAFAPAHMKPDSPRICPVDGSPLRADGFCVTGDGFPITLAHPPDTCPHCHAPLRWDGDCQLCLPPSGKPGHLYDHDPYNPTNPHSAHWRVVQHGPQMIAPPAPDQQRMLNAALVHTAVVKPPQPKPLFKRALDIIRLA